MLWDKKTVEQLLKILTFDLHIWFHYLQLGLNFLTHADNCVGDVGPKLTVCVIFVW